MLALAWIGLLWAAPRRFRAQLTKLIALEVREFLGERLRPCRSPESSQVP